MNKSFIGILSCFLLGVLLIANHAYAATAGYKYNRVPVKQPVMTANMKPGVAMYQQGNYLGAMQEFEDIVKKDYKNTYAKYYLALACTQLGYEEKANKYFQEVADSDTNYALAYYSKRALACLGNPDSEECVSLNSKATSGYNVDKKADGTSPQEDDDITQFIKSGKKIHPAAMDKIMNEKLQRQLQADLYSIQQQSQEQQSEEQPARKRKHRTSDASMPTKEEILSALDVLDKAGLNPYRQVDYFSLINSPTDSLLQYDTFFNPSEDTFLSDNSLDTTKALIYAQLAKQNLNYGI